MIGIDTSVLVRYLVGSPREQAERAKRLFESDDEIGVSILVLLEAAHVLRTQYGVARSHIVDRLIELLARENVTSLEIGKVDTMDALQRARSFESAPIADALIAAAGRALGAVPIFTFDKRFARLGSPVAAP